MTKLPLACGLILTLAACASSGPAGTASANPATGAPAAGTAAPAPQAAAKPKLVCEETKPLGSLLPQRVCMSPEEAAQRKKAAQDAMRNMQQQSQVGPGAGSSNGG
jgi:hypothetical protein